MAVAHDPLPMMAMLPGKLEGIRGAGEGRNRRVIFLRIDINNAKKEGSYPNLHSSPVVQRTAVTLQI